MHLSCKFLRLYTQMHQRFHTRFNISGKSGANSLKQNNVVLLVWKEIGHWFRPYDMNSEYASRDNMD